MFVQMNKMKFGQLHIRNRYYIFLVEKSEKGDKNGIMFVKTYVLQAIASETLV